MALENLDYANNETPEDTIPTTSMNKGLPLQELVKFSQPIIKKPLSVELDVKPVALTEPQGVLDISPAENNNPVNNLVVDKLNAAKETLKNFNIEQSDGSYKSLDQMQSQNIQNIVTEEVGKAYENYYSGVNFDSAKAESSIQEVVTQAENLINTDGVTEAEIALMILALEGREDKNDEVKAIIAKLYDKQVSLVIKVEVDLSNIQSISTQIIKLQALRDKVSGTTLSDLNNRISDLEKASFAILSKDLPNMDKIAA